MTADIELSAEIRSAAAVRDLGTILGIWAHPDDEAYRSGGLMAIARNLGSRVVCVTATRGELGTPDPEQWPPDKLAAERTVELACSLGVLGVTEHHWLGYRDGECASVPLSEVVPLLCEIIGRVAPDTVVTFGPDGVTGHADHIAVSKWVDAAFDQAGAPGARLLHTVVPEGWAQQWATVNDSLGVFETGYPVAVPDDQLDLVLELDPATVAQKVRALRAQATQTATLIDVMGQDSYTAWVSTESFVQRR